MISQYLPVSDWLESIIGYRGLNGLDHSIKDTIINCKATFVFPSLTGHIGLLNGEAIEIITLSLIRSYIINLNL